MRQFDYQVGYDLINFDEFVQFLNAVEQDFVPPLLKRINVFEYYNKCRSKAAFAVCRQEDEIVGLVVFYCNDVLKKEAFAVLLAVKKEWRGNAIAKALLDCAASFSKQHGMEMMGLYTSSEIACRAYIKSGFEVKSAVDLENMNLKRYYMERCI